MSKYWSACFFKIFKVRAITTPLKEVENDIIDAYLFRTQNKLYFNKGSNRIFKNAEFKIFINLELFRFNTFKMIQNAVNLK